MHVSRKKPTEVKKPVYINDNCYELYYSKPVNLGRITKQGKYWYTEDGLRFISSRDALNYLVNLSRAANPKEVEEMRKQAITKAEKKVVTPVKEKHPPHNQNHPQFQKWLEFMEWSKRSNP